MKKKCVVYISNTDILAVNAQYQKDGLYINEVFKYPLNEGTMLNGVIIDDVTLKKTLEKLKAENVHEIHLVVDSAKILAKAAMIPVMNEKQILQFVKDELSVIENNTSDSLVYDYAYLGKGEQAANASKILCVGVERKFIESYLDLFKEVGITIKSIDYAINALISYVKKIPSLVNKTYVLSQIDGQNINSVVFINNEYVLTSRSRIYANAGSDTYYEEIGRIISQLKQFASSSTYKTPISDVYFFGVNKEEEQSLFDSVYTLVGVNVDRVPVVDEIHYPQGLELNMNDYLCCLGSFNRK